MSDTKDLDYSDAADQQRAGYRKVNVLRCRVQGGADGTMQTQAVEDDVAEETPVALVYNGISHAVMMLTPRDLEDFAVGFSLSERIIDTRAQIYDLEIIEAADSYGLEIQLTIAAECFSRLKEKRRQLAGRTGCGVCGTESLDALDLDLPRLQADFSIEAAALLKAFNAMQGLQTINAVTGATHAAAWVERDGSILALREDVGRHNALDKLIGALALATTARGDGFTIMSSRASYELVQKAARANMSILATVSAPTSLAIRMAEQAGISLVGFARSGGFVAYTHVNRLITK